MRTLVVVIGLGLGLAVCGTASVPPSDVPVGSSVPVRPFGWDHAALAAVISLAAETNSDALIVLDHGGTVVKEYFGKPAGLHP